MTQTLEVDCHLSLEMFVSVRAGGGCQDNADARAAWGDEHGDACVARDHPKLDREGVDDASHVRVDANALRACGHERVRAPRIHGAIPPMPLSRPQ